MTLVQVTFTHAGFMNKIFKSEGLDFDTWIEIIVISFSVMFVVEIKRYIDSKIRA